MRHWNLLQKKDCRFQSQSATDAAESAQVNRAHGVVVSHPLSMREALGSIPSVSNTLICAALPRLKPKSLDCGAPLAARACVADGRLKTHVRGGRQEVAAISHVGPVPPVTLAAAHLRPFGPCWAGIADGLLWPSQGHVHLLVRASGRCRAPRAFCEAAMLGFPSGIIR